MASNNGPVITHFRITHPNNTDGRNNQVSRQETEGQVTPMPRYRMERPNNTDGRNSLWTSQLSRLETAVQEDRSISAVYEQSASASGFLLEIRKLAAARRPELYANQIYEFANVAIAMHAQIQQLTTTIANDEAQAQGPRDRSEEAVRPRSADRLE